MRSIGYSARSSTSPSAWRPPFLVERPQAVVAFPLGCARRRGRGGRGGRSQRPQQLPVAVVGQPLGGLVGAQPGDLVDLGRRARTRRPRAASASSGRPWGGRASPCTTSTRAPARASSGGRSPPRPRAAPPSSQPSPSSSLPFGNDQSSYFGRWMTSTSSSRRTIPPAARTVTRRACLRARACARRRRMRRGLPVGVRLAARRAGLPQTPRPAPPRPPAREAALWSRPHPGARP